MGITNCISLKRVGSAVIGGVMMFGLYGCNAAARDYTAATVLDEFTREVVRGNVGNDVNNYNNEAVSLEDPYIAIRRWKDFNENGKRDDGELLGKIKDSVNMSNTGIHIQIEDYTSTGATFYILDSDDNVVSNTTNPTRAVIWPKRFLEPGEYKVIVKRGDLTLTREFRAE